MTESATTRDPLEGDDYVLDTEPDWLPSSLSKWAMDLTYDEVHAFVMGVFAMFVGVFTGTWEFLIIGGMLAYGARRTRGFVQRIIMHEPWYWTGGAVVGAPLAVMLDAMMVGSDFVVHLGGMLP